MCATEQTSLAKIHDQEVVKDTSSVVFETLKG